MDEEAKSILKAIQGQIGTMQVQIGTLQEQIGTMQEQIGTTQGQVGTLQEQIASMQVQIKEGDERNYKEIRAVNQRLAVFEHEITKKIDALFDADTTRKELLEIHDDEIPEIKSKLFEHSIRIDILESKVIGA